MTFLDVPEEKHRFVKLIILFLMSKTFLTISVPFRFICILFLIFVTCIYLCVCLCTRAQLLRGDQRTTVRSQFSFSTMWVQGLTSGQQAWWRTPLPNNQLLGPHMHLQKSSSWVQYKMKEETINLVPLSQLNLDLTSYHL